MIQLNCSQLEERSIHSQSQSNTYQIKLVLYALKFHFNADLLAFSKLEDTTTFENVFADTRGTDVWRRKIQLRQEGL